MQRQIALAALRWRPTTRVLVRSLRAKVGVRTGHPAAHSVQKARWKVFLKACWNTEWLPSRRLSLVERRRIVEGIVEPRLAMLRC